MRLSQSSSILLAGVIIALGLYFGLRTPTPTPAPAPTVEALAPPPAPPQLSEAQLSAEVTAAVTQAYPRWKAACWDTADPATRTPGRYISSLAFDAGGKLTISGITELRDASDPAIAQCLRAQVNAFTISAPGYPVAYDVPIRMP